jgi:hypothetical protein
MKTRLFGIMAMGFALATSAIAACTNPPPGMVGWWPGDGNANDIVSTNNGALINGATFANGEVGQAFSFNGAGQAVEVSDAPNLNFATNAPMSVDCWVFRTGTEHVMHFVGKRSGCADSTFLSYQLALNTDSGQGLVFGAYPTEAASGLDLPLNVWTHLAGTFDGGTYRLYVNGVLVASGAGSLGPTTSAPLLIGSSGDCVTMDGLIDEVEVYSRALSDAEVAAIFNAGSDGKCKPSCVPTGLVGWWPGDGNANDIVGGNNGTPINGATFGSGEVGQAFSFDGAGQVIEVPDAPSLNFATNAPMSVDCWAFRTGTEPLMHFVGKRSGCGDSSSLSYQLALNTVSGEGLVFNSVAGEAYSGLDLPLNVWTHLAGTFDGTTLRLYVNGALVATNAGSLGPTTSASLLIGGSGDCATTDGLIDEVEIYNRALSDAEVAAIFNAGSTGKCKPEFRITAIARASNDIRLTWITTAGKTNFVQATNGDANGGYTNNFADISPSIVVAGSGSVTTNFFDTGGATNKPSRYYRIRLLLP